MEAFRKRIRLLIISLLMAFNYTFSQEVIITGDAILNITPNVTFVFSNGGKLINNSTTDTLNGKFIFSGPDTMGIGGTQATEFFNLSLENEAFVSLSNNIKVNTELNLVSGILNLLNNNLTILDGATITGTFSENNMIAADSDGKLQFEIAGNGTYLFPVGDTTGTNDYSPVNLIFNSGSYSDAVVSVNLKNEKHSNNSSPSNYLDRYWSLSQTGISGFECDVEFNYTNEDIQGTESDIYGGKWNGSYWTPLNQASLNAVTGTVNDFSDFTGGDLSALTIEDIDEYNVEIIVNGNLITINSENNAKLVRADIYNLLGQKLFTKNLENADNHEIDFNAASDYYLIKVSFENSFITKKVFIK